MTTMNDLLTQLAHPDWATRLEAIRLLSDLGSIALPALEQTLDDPHQTVRRRAAWALGKIGDPAAVPALIAALRDPQGEVRFETARSLGYIGVAAAVPALITALRDPDNRTRGCAIWALGEIGDPSAVPGLVKRLKDPETFWVWDEARLCDTAAESLQKIGTLDALTALEKWRRQQNDD